MPESINESWWNPFTWGQQNQNSAISIGNIERYLRIGFNKPPRTLDVNDQETVNQIVERLIAAVISGLGIKKLQQIPANTVFDDMKKQSGIPSFRKAVDQPNFTTGMMICNLLTSSPEINVTLKSNLSPKEQIEYLEQSLINGTALRSEEFRDQMIDDTTASKRDFKYLFKSKSNVNVARMVGRENLNYFNKMEEKLGTLKPDIIKSLGIVLTDGGSPSNLLSTINENYNKKDIYNSYLVSKKGDNKMSLKRRRIRKVVINENIKLFKHQIYLEKKKINESIKKYNDLEKEIKALKTEVLKEFKIPGTDFDINVSDILSKGKDFVVDDLKKSVAKAPESAIDVGEEEIIDVVAGMLGLKPDDLDSEAKQLFYEVLKQTFENMNLMDMAGIFLGTTSKDQIVEDVIQGLAEALTKYGIKKLYHLVEEIPVLNMLVPNEETLFGAVGGEIVQEKVADFAVEKLKPEILKMIDKLSFSDILSGASKLMGLSESINYEIDVSRRKIKQYNRNLKILNSLK